MARLIEFLSNWIDTIDKFNYCPFAKKAWDNDKCKVVMVEDFTLDNYWSIVSEECMTYDPLKQISMEPENIWTHLWLEDCLDKGKIAPMQFFHQPITIEPDFEPFKDVVIGK